MARQPLDPPSPLGRRISSIIRREMGGRRISGRALAKLIGKSESYVRERLKDTYEFTLADVEAFCAALGIEPEAFFASLEHVTQPDNIEWLRMADEATRPNNVAGRREDYDLVANDSIDELPDDPDSGYDHA